MKKSLLFIFSMVLVMSLDAQSLEDTLKNLPHVHSPVFSGSGNESIVCYKSSHRNTFFAITGLIVALAIVLFKLYVFNRKTTHKLQKQKQIIEEKNKDITDSINYARRLQNAILPPTEQVNAIMPEHFILYQPKDIVSGDFYWISDLDDDIFVAAIDCTGHGIPGALLSIIGHNAINKSINELKIRQPATIMDSMNNTVKKVLHQEEGSNLRDGMDMALCNLNRKTGALQYAGANNNLYIVSDNKLSIVKASKLTVGTVEEHITEPPINHSLQLKKGDCFYIFSDGYADQFGGIDNKKFKSVRFQELLLSISHLPMSEQQAKLLTAFTNWKGNNEQVDDVLVIGVRY